MQQMYLSTLLLDLVALDPLLDLRCLDDFCFLVD